MSSKEHLFRIQFIANGERYELYVREVCQGSMFGFIEIGDFVWDTHTSLVLDPSHEKLKDEFADVTRTYVPMHSVSKITALSDKVTAFPTPIYTPKNTLK